MGIFAATVTFPDQPPTAEHIEARVGELLGEPFELFGYTNQGATINLLVGLDSVAFCYLLRVLYDLGGQSDVPLQAADAQPDFVRTPWAAIPTDERARILEQFPHELRRKP